MPARLLVHVHAHHSTGDRAHTLFLASRLSLTKRVLMCACAQTSYTTGTHTQGCDAEVAVLLLQANTWRVDAAVNQVSKFRMIFWFARMPAIVLCACGPVSAIDGIVGVKPVIA